MDEAITRFRILEWTTVRRHGPPSVEFEVQCKTVDAPDEWSTLGTSRTIDDARKAMLFYVPTEDCARD